MSLSYEIEETNVYHFLAPMLFKYGLKEPHDICLVGKPESEATSTLPIVS